MARSGELFPQITKETDDSAEENSSPRSKASIRSAADYLPQERTLSALQSASCGCKGCDLYRYATQTVFGEGPRHAAIMMVGEQPGDQEDIQGKPFVGPAGRLLDTALEAAGIPRKDVYVTNAVKHFKFVPRGSRRIHEKPRLSEITACKPWLTAELEVVKPRIVVAMGATAVQSLFGKPVKILVNRGSTLERPGLPPVFITVHPSSVLRAQDAAAREDAEHLLVEDLKKLRPWLKPAK